MSDKKSIDELGTIHLASECYVIRGSKVLMFQRSPTASRFPGFLIGPGGQIDQGEDAMVAAIREVKEEAGVIVGPKDIKLKSIAIHHHLDRNEVWVSFIYLATISQHQKTIKEDEEKKGKARWLRLKDLEKEENVFPPTKYYFDHVLKDKPGIMYTNIEWKNAQLVRVLSERIDKNG